MEHESETIELNVRDYISPECSCKIEEIVNSIPHVLESAFDPVSNRLTVKVHRGMASANDVVKALEKCKIHCEEGQPHHEMGKVEHEAIKMKMPAKHDHHAMMESELKNRFVVAAVFTIPVLILSPSVQGWAGCSLPSSPVWNVLLVIFASIVILYGGFIFYKGSIAAFRIRTLDMNVLVSIALLAGYLYSVGAIFFFTAADFYWEISTLASFILFGHWMEMKAERSAAGALKQLVKLIPPTANLLRDDKVVEVPTAELKVGDIILVKPGEKIPIDGVVTKEKPR
jgi:Cu2+-exporting ATPase